MKKIIGNQKGMTLVEIIVSFAIASILLISVVGGLLFMQKSIIYNDEKNNNAAKGQELLDEIGNWLASGIRVEDLPEDTGSSDLPEIFKNTSKVTSKVNGKADFKPPTEENNRKSKQYYVDYVDESGAVVNTLEKAVGYNTYVCVYFLDNNSQVNFNSFTRKKKSAGTI